MLVATHLDVQSQMPMEILQLLPISLTLFLQTWNGDAQGSLCGVAVDTHKHMGCILYEHCPSSKPCSAEEPNHSLLLITSTKNK